MTSYLLRSVAFWGTFYASYHYARRDPVTRQHVYPSYAILKQKVLKDTWTNGFEGDSFSKSCSEFRTELWSELKSLSK